MHWSKAVWLVLSVVGAYIVLGIVLRITGGYAPGWQVRCRKCGKTRDAAEVGVVRGGSLKSKLTYGWCENCRRVRTFMVERKPEAQQPPGATVP
jgi:hypothetical protein